MKKRTLLLLAALLLAGCATDRALLEGERLVNEGRAEEGIGMLAEAVRRHPDRVEYRAALIRAREAHIGRLLREADADVGAARFDQAEVRYRDVLRQHPENPRALAGLAGLAELRRNRQLYAEAEAALGRDDLETAGSLLRAILVREPAYPEAAALLRRIEDRAGRERIAEPPQLAAAYRRPVSLEFRDVPVRSVFDAISRQGGLNFTFDKDVRGDQRTTLFARDTPLAEALDMLLTANQLARKVLGGNTLLIYPNTPAKQKEYQDIVVRGFFLANAEPKQTMNLLRSMARIRDVHVDEKLNMVVVRDSPEAVRLAERLIRMADQAEPEVMLQVEILEVKRSRLLELGLQWPNQFSLLTPEATVTSHVEGGVIVTDSVPGGRLTIDSLKSITGATVGVSPNPTLNLNKIDGDVNLLANPRIRVRNREKARVHIGDKVPVITANVTSTGVTSESVAYLDVGLKLDVEPQVYLDAEVAIKVGLEVSNIVQQVKSATGTLTYQLGSRNASTVLRLKDGETQVLAGLISDEERASAAKVPGLGELPLLGRLFSSHRDDSSKTEIVLLITPHVIRNVTRPALADGEFFAGTEGMAAGQPLRLRPSGRLARQNEAAEAIPAGRDGEPPEVRLEGQAQE